MATFASGTYVWVPDDDECFVPARVDTKFKAGSPGSVTLLTSSGKSGKKSKGKSSQLNAKESDKLLPMDEQSLDTLDNMVELKQLNEASILHNLRARFAKKEIYTNIGSILVSINPFEMLPLYTPRVLDGYMKQGSRGLPPHVYGVADNAYKALRGFGKSQSCIVSGESGAGKTEATKLFLQYIAEVSSGGIDASGDGGNGKKDSKKSKKDKKKGDKDNGGSGNKVTIQSQVLEANPLMEAFGNAKTVRNDNSSR
jgi:myosin heavy subunit